MAVWQLCDYRSDVMCQYASLKTAGRKSMVMLMQSIASEVSPF
jgi:hypothetical protein